MDGLDGIFRNVFWGICFCGMFGNLFWIFWDVSVFLGHCSGIFLGGMLFGIGPRYTDFDSGLNRK